jgi:hypothetical protein
MSFMLYEQTIEKVGYAVGYLRSTDRAVTWQRCDGTPVELPATPGTIDIVAGAETADGPANFRPGNIAVDSGGVPWLIYCRMDRQPFDTWIARPDPKRVFRKLIVGPSPSEKPQGTKAEAGDVGSIVDAGRQSHGALQPGEARATFETPSKTQASSQSSLQERS